MGVWRPQQWNSQAIQKVIVTFPGQGTGSQYATATGVTVVLPTGKTLYAFDTEIQVEHQQQLRKTEHPVQTGASISDHAFLEPARLIMDVGMSDAMDAYFAGVWTGSPYKSISAYQTMLALQFSRIPLLITTRLRSYQNMLIENLVPTDTYKTFGGLRMRVEFGQIFLSNIEVATNSARPNETNQTNLGAVTTQPVTAAQQSQYQVPAGEVTATLAGQPVVFTPSGAIGAGNYSSVNTNNLSALPAAK